jgi:hypothetical protein
MADLSHLRGAVYNLAVARFGGAFVEEDAELTLTTTVAEAAPNDPERVVLALVNLGAVPLYVAPFRSVTTTRGIALSPSGGALILSADTDLTLTSREWFAISTQTGHTAFRLTLRRFSLVGGDKRIFPD